MKKDGREATENLKKKLKKVTTSAAKNFKIMHENHLKPLKSLKIVLAAINDQTVIPNEVVIVDSSIDDDIQKLVIDYEDLLPIVYHREKKAFPGKARNIGVSMANSHWIAFLDSKTVPKEDWLERYQHFVKAYHADVVFGLTRFDAVTPFQKTLRAATYGMIGHHTVPGTVIKKKVFSGSDGFLEHVRMGEDIEWRERLIKNGFNIHRPNKPVVTYYDLPDNIFTTIKKYMKG